MTIRMDEGAAELLDTLHKAGYAAYVVGGCVRDSLLGLSLIHILQGGRTFLQKSGNGLRHHEQKNFCRTRIKNGNLLANKVGLCYTCLLYTSYTR